MTLRLNSVLLKTLLFAGLAHSLHAQDGWWNPLNPPPAAQPKPVQTFKAGDYVDGQFGDHWIPCTLKEPVYYGPGGPCGAQSPTCSTIGAYNVTCVYNAPSGPQQFTLRVADVRARAGTAEDKSMADETAGALARQPHGNTVGAKYGTRDPRICSTRTAPAHGAPSAGQASQYVICELERADGIYPITLVANVKVQVAPVSHAASQVFTVPSDFDPREPVWDIRGSLTSYSCTALGSLMASNDFARTHNCSVSDVTVGTGICYKNTFGDWHCMLGGGASNSRPNVLPPAGN